MFSPILSNFILCSFIDLPFLCVCVREREIVCAFVCELVAVCVCEVATSVLQGKLLWG